MKNTIRIPTMAILGLMLITSGASAQYSLKIAVDDPASSYKEGNVINCSVYIDLTNAGPTGDDTYSWGFSVKFDGNELEWVEPSANDKGTNLSLYIPTDWSAYPATGGSPIYEYTEPNTIVLLSAAKKVFPAGEDWNMKSEVLLASFDLKLKELELQDGLLDVWTYHTSDIGEVFGFRTAGIYPVENAPYPDGGPDFGTNPVPEPGAILLFGFGLMGLIRRKLRR